MAQQDIVVHYLTWATSSTYLCGADAVGRRNTRRDTNRLNTTCAACIAKGPHTFPQGTSDQSPTQDARTKVLAASAA